MSSEDSVSQELFDNFEDSIYECISFKDLKLRRLRKNKEEENPLPFEIPPNSGAILKTHLIFNEEMGRKLPMKSFYIYNEDDGIEKSQKTDKRGISKLLKEALLFYIKTKNQLNNNFQLNEKSVTKNGIVKYELMFSDFATFFISIKPIELETDDVSLFIIELPIEKTSRILPKIEKWKVEYAKSSRASCKLCGEKILKDTVRLGQPSYFNEYLSYKWYHLDCNKFFGRNSGLDGLDNLSDEDKKLVLAKLNHEINETEESDLKSIIERIITEYADSTGLTNINDLYKGGKDKNIEKSDIDEILTELEEEGKIYYPEPFKINLI